jgi:hypothetical protein
MHRLHLNTLLLAGIGFMVAIPAYAHHSFAAEFDATKCQDFNGTLTGVEWQNPHGYFHVDVKSASGATEAWTFQTVSIITMKRSGTSRQDMEMNIGKQVFVRGCLAKNGVKNRAAAETLKMSDGQTRIVGQEVEHGGRQEY